MTEGAYLYILHSHDGSIDAKIAVIPYTLLWDKRRGWL